ncbi:hypothetical protein GCM10023088_36320 [Actinomadura verrucosospora]|uniref:hypothetical protein n=1 Tax=Actinomadura verrucosospora TaxID=46165 RepID=UPI0031E5D300
MSALELRYRRLLACYPAGHRAEHGEEMLDVLMSAARPGQTRPSLADTADLLLGAVRIRLRRATGDATGSPWPGALAVAGLVAMIMLVADGVRFAVNVPHLGMVFAERVGEGGWPMLASYVGTAPYWAAWAVIATLAWRGARRPATVAACAVTAAQLLLALWAATFTEAPYAPVASSVAGIPLALALLATASLVASPGPRHGARRLGRARVAGLVAMAGVLVALSSHPLFALVFQGDLGQVGTRDIDRLVTFSQKWGYVQFVAALAIGVLVCADLARSRQGRRAAALLAIAGLPLLVRVGLFHMGSSGEPPALTHLLAEGLAGFAVTMVCVRLAELPLKTGAPGRAGEA